MNKRIILYLDLMWKWSFIYYHYQSQRVNLTQGLTLRIDFRLGDRKSLLIKISGQKQNFWSLCTILGPWS